MVLLDDDIACTFCNAHLETQQEFVLHLSMKHNVHSGPSVQITYPQYSQSVAPTAYISNGISHLASPFAPADRQPQSLTHAPQLRRPIPYPVFSYPPQHTANTHLLTPPSSTGSASPLPPPQRSVHTPSYGYPSPYSEPQETPLYSTSHQNGAHMVYGNMLPRQNAGYITQHALPQQGLQRHFSASDQHTPTSGSKRKAPTPNPAQEKLPPGLPPLPQAVYDLGLTDADFDPEIVYSEKRIIQSRYVDIPASIDIADAHMFNANPVTILGYGNLLRLAGRYADWEITAKANAGRPGFFRNTLIKKRIQAAVKWAAARPEWRVVGDVQVWLDNKQRARQNDIDHPRCKRKREDDDAQEIVTVDSNEVHGHGKHPAGLRPELSTPPPARRMRPAALTPSMTPSGCDGDSQSGKSALKSQSSGATQDTSCITTSSSGAPVRQKKSAAITLDLTSPTPTKDTFPAGLSFGTSDDASNAVAAPSARPYSSSDLNDLADICGGQNAMALVDALGIRDEFASATNKGLVAEEGPAPTVSATVQPGENYDEIFEEFLAHPEQFMSTGELEFGETWAKYVEICTQRRGMIR